MVLFDFKSDKHFVASSDRTTLKVYELTNPAVNPSSTGKDHWKEVATITARDQDQSNDKEQDDGDDASAEEEEEEFYDGLMFFDGHGKIEGREALTKLAQHLTRLQLRVSPQGFCFQDVTGLGEHKDFGFHYLRLNDFFNWSYHGIKIAGIITWRRLVLQYSVPKGEKKQPMAGGAAVSKKKYEELKRMIEERDEKIGKMREDMEEQDWEMEKLKEERGKHGVELRELEKKNGKELRKLSKQKDGELETLKREKDGELEEKDEELEVLRKEKDDATKLSKEKDEKLKNLKEEVKNMKRAKKEDEAATVGEKGKILVDSDEWHKLKKDEAEMRQEVTKKDAESQKLTKENEAETEKLRNQLLQLRLQLEQRRKQSWVQTATTKLVGLSLCNDDIISRRRPMPRDSFCVDESKSSSSNYDPYTKGSLPFPITSFIRMVDEDPKDWPPPPKINVYSFSGSFDQDNWWIMKATAHLSGSGLTMMAYYDGSFRCSVFPENSYPIRLPYAWENRFTTDATFILVHVGCEYKLAFMYRE